MADAQLHSWRLEPSSFVSSSRRGVPVVVHHKVSPFRIPDVLHRQLAQSRYLSSATGDDWARVPRPLVLIAFVHSCSGRILLASGCPYLCAHGGRSVYRRMRILVTGDFHGGGRLL